MNESWKDLRIGDQIQIVRMPSEFSDPAIFVQKETADFYQLLIDRKEILTVEQFCHDGFPWISYDEKLCNGEVTNHSLAVNDDSWELVTQ